MHPPTDEKKIANKVYCDSNILSSSNKNDILSKNIIELRKGEFDKATTKTLQLSKIQVNEELINKFIQSTNEFTNTVNFCNKVASDTIIRYNQLKQEFANIKFNQSFTNIHLDDMFTTGLKEFKEVNKKSNSAVDEKKTIVQYLVAILLESKLVDNKEQARLEMHYDFNLEDIMEEIESYFNI